jgi:hypothetical protein
MDKISSSEACNELEVKRSCQAVVIVDLLPSDKQESIPQARAEKFSIDRNALSGSAKIVVSKDGSYRLSFPPKVVRLNK